MRLKASSCSWFVSIEGASGCHWPNVGVLGFPIAERHPQRVEQRAIGIDAITARGDDFVLRGKSQVVRPPPAFEQVFERFAEHPFAAAARYLPEPVELGAIFVD